MLSTKGPKDLAWPERRITLTRDNPSMPIGRASKVRSKGFVASSTNGWFDSPVMSRDHAELIADLDTRVRCISACLDFTKLTIFLRLSASATSDPFTAPS